MAPEKKNKINSKPGIGRNSLCSCGSGKKYKKYCLQSSINEERSFSPKFRFEPGSYGDAGGFMSSLACLRQKSPVAWDYHFVLVKTTQPYLQEDAASSQAEKDLNAAFLQKGKSGSSQAIAEYLKAQGYVSVTDFNIVKEDVGKCH